MGRLHPAHVVAGSLCLGLAAANVVRATSFSLVLCGGVALLVAWCAERQARLGLLALALLLVGCCWGSVRLAALDHSVLAAKIGTADNAIVEVTAPPRAGSFDVRVRARVLRYGSLRPHENVLLELPQGREPPQGSILSLVGVLEAPRGPSHGFDERGWLRHSVIHVVVRAGDFRIVGHRGGLGGVADRLHGWLARDSALGLTGERRAVVTAIVLGETQGIDQGLLARFRASGLYHVLAVDGLKVTAVAAGAGGLAFLLGAGRFLAELVALAAVAGYVLAVGAHPVRRPCRRCRGARLARLADGAAARPLAGAPRRRGCPARLEPVPRLRRRLPALVRGGQLDLRRDTPCGAGARGLSGAAASRPVDRRLHRVRARDRARDLVAVPQVSLVTVPANVVGVPLVAEMLVLALLTAIVAPVAAPLSKALAQVNGWGASALVAWTRFTGGLPFAQVTSGRSLLLLLALCAFGFALWNRHEVLALVALAGVAAILLYHTGPTLSPQRASWTVTPGALNPDVTQDNIDGTICKRGWTATIRPPESYTNALKVRQMRVYRRAGSTSDYQEDHLISLELGGNPTDPRNLWPEPYPRASDVDQIENQLNAQVCSGQLTLADAQRRESILKHTAG